MSKLAVEARVKAGVKAPTGRRAVVPLPTGGPKVKVKSLRLEPAHETGLGLLKVLLHKPLNRMVNEAVGEYIDKRTAEAEARTAGTLERLKAYRRGDPDFERDFAAFIAAEARHGKSDPMEGVVYTVALPTKRRAGADKAGSPNTRSALKMVRDLIRG